MAYGKQIAYKPTINIGDDQGRVGVTGTSNLANPFNRRIRKQGKID